MALLCIDLISCLGSVRTCILGRSLSIQLLRNRSLSINLNAEFCTEKARPLLAIEKEVATSHINVYLGLSMPDIML
jgi:hypothetical protein